MTGLLAAPQESRRALHAHCAHCRPADHFPTEISGAAHNRPRRGQVVTKQRVMVQIARSGGEGTGPPRALRGVEEGQAERGWGAAREASSLRRAVVT